MKSRLFEWIVISVCVLALLYVPYNIGYALLIGYLFGQLNDIRHNLNKQP